MGGSPRPKLDYFLLVFAVNIIIGSRVQCCVQFRPQKPPGCARGARKSVRGDPSRFRPFEYSPVFDSQVCRSLFCREPFGGWWDAHFQLFPFRSGDMFSCLA
jgi:hypothetical protein